MKVLFLNAPWWVPQPNGELFKGVRAGSRWGHGFRSMSTPGNFVFGDYVPYPFFMGYAATYAGENTQAEIYFRDSIALSESYGDLYAYLWSVQPDMIFFESSTPSWEHDKAYLAYLADNFPRTSIVITGTIVTTRAQEILALPGVVAAIQGEYEKGSVRAINGQRGLILRGLLTQDEMNAAPFPWLDDLHAHRYCDHNPQGQVFPHLQAWTSRGCFAKCSHCEWPATMTGDDPDGTRSRKVRLYSAEYLESFLKYAVERFGFKSVYFDGDTENQGNRHTAKICAVMRNVGLPWSAMCRIDTIDRAHWKLMRDSGCFGVKIGYESGNQYVVDMLIKKGLDLNEARETTKYLKSLGMTVHGTFMSGIPGETHAQMQQTLDYIKSLPLDSYQHSGMAELEGAPVHTLRERGEMQDANYTRENDGARAIEKILKQMREE